MNTTIPNSLTRVSPMFLRDLKVSTNIRLHPDFPKSPQKFADKYDVNLVAGVSPEATFSRNKDTGGRDTILKVNIHLVAYGAIRLFAQMKGDSFWIRSIDLCPALLLHGAEVHLVTETEFLRALTRLRMEVAPLLADPSDIQHIVPGLTRNAPPLSYWSELAGELLLPDVHVPCLHHLTHPAAGSEQGRTATRIQLGDENDEYMIRLERTTWRPCKPEGIGKVEGAKVTVKLQCGAIPATFGVVGAISLIDEKRQLIRFPASGVGIALRTLVSKLEGTYMPVPQEWKAGQSGRSLTLAKEIALLSAITPIPAEELVARAKGLWEVSSRTNKRLDAAVQKELVRLEPVPVSELFTESVFSPEIPGDVVQALGSIDDGIAEAYGS